MALVPCPECQKEVSTQALACPHCAFPFPGKQGLSEDSQSNKLSSCPGCGFLVSRQARACPHCGQALGEQIHQATNENVSEETSLCPHCGTPYTQKVKRQENAVLAPQEKSSIIQPGKGLQTSEIATGQNDNLTEIESFLPLCTRPPLWQDPAVREEASSPRYPRSRKNSIVVGLIIFVLVATTIALGAIWQLQDINPLEVLVYWRM